MHFPVFLQVSCAENRTEAGTDLAEMAAAGVYLHGLAGDRAAEKNGMCGMKAGDILKNVSGILRGEKNEKI